MHKAGLERLPSFYLAQARGAKEDGIEDKNQSVHLSTNNFSLANVKLHFYFSDEDVSLFLKGKNETLVMRVTPVKLESYAKVNKHKYYQQKFKK